MTILLRISYNTKFQRIIALPNLQQLSDSSGTAQAISGLDAAVTKK